MCFSERLQRNKRLNPLSSNPEKWSNTLKQIVGSLPTICLSVFDHFMNLALKGLLLMTEKWRKSPGEGGGFGALLKPSIVYLMNC